MSNLEVADIRDFVKGQEDCRDGKPHASGSDAYNRGYEYEYWCQQRHDAKSVYQDEEMRL